MDEAIIKEIVDAGGDIAAALTEAVNEEISGLRANKDKILQEKKDLSIKVDNLSKKVDSFDFTGYNDMKQQLEKDKLIKSGSSQELADLQLSVTRLETERDNLAQKLEDSTTATEDIRTKLADRSISAALTKAFTDAGVLSDTLTVLESAFFGRAEAQHKDDGSVEVLIKTPEGGLLPVKDWVDGWASSPQAKPFLKANATSGGGAGGSNGTGGKSKSQMTLDEQTNYYKTHGKAAYEALPK
jgi:hypothetical protein